MMPKTDTQLIAGTLAGDRSAAGLLMDRHRNLAFVMACRALGNTDDALDVAQESLVYALLRLADLRDRSQFGPWLKHITLSHCADYRRRRGTRRLGEPIAMLTEVAEETDYAGRIAIRTAVERLSDSHRTTVLLHYMGGWTLTEVAALLDVPLNTVRSRLMAAKRLLRAELELPFAQRISMPTTTHKLSASHMRLLDIAFPGADIARVQNDPEPWQMFSPRVTLTLPDGSERIIDFRADITQERADLLPALRRLGIPVPRLLSEITGRDLEVLALAEPPLGENLSLWALGGTPHRIRIATECAFEGIDRLQSITPALSDDPIGKLLPRRTLSDEAAALTDHDLWKGDIWLNNPGSQVEKWRLDPWFRDAVCKVQAAVADMHDPLVYTDYMHFFPGSYRIHAITPQVDIEAPLGWPGDIRLTENTLAEFSSPYGHFGDPLLGLAMVWIYDCYPFVHTGFVEQFLWRRGVSRRDFAPRLALRALQTIARELPVERPDVDGWWDAVRGYAQQGLDWM